MLFTSTPRVSATDQKYCVYLLPTSVQRLLVDEVCDSWDECTVLLVGIKSPSICIWTCAQRPLHPQAKTCGIHQSTNCDDSLGPLRCGTVAMLDIAVMCDQPADLRYSTAMACSSWGPGGATTMPSTDAVRHIRHAEVLQRVLKCVSLVKLTQIHQ